MCVLLVTCPGILVYSLLVSSLTNTRLAAHLPSSHIPPTSTTVYVAPISPTLPTLFFYLLSLMPTCTTLRQSGTCTDGSSAGHSSRILGLHWMWHATSPTSCNSSVMALDARHTNPYRVDGKFSYCGVYNNRAENDKRCDFVWLEGKCRRLFRSNIFDKTKPALQSSLYGIHLSESCTSRTVWFV